MMLSKDSAYPWMQSQICDEYMLVILLVVSPRATTVTNSFRCGDTTLMGGYKGNYLS